MGAGSAADCRRDRLPGRFAVYPARSRRRKFGSGFRERAVLLRREPKKWEGHYLPGFAAERSVRARVVSALWVQTMLVCEPEHSASRGRSGEDYGNQFFRRKNSSGSSPWWEMGTNLELDSCATFFIRILRQAGPHYSTPYLTLYRIPAISSLTASGRRIDATVDSKTSRIRQVPQITKPR
jgi:hypothetical protein